MATPRPVIRLLLVDDHPVVREGLRTMMQSFEAVDLIAVCATGQEALEIVLQQPVDIVLADMRMTPMDGVQLLRSLRKQSPAIKVIIFSSYELEEDIFQALTAGAYGYLNKYASEEELLSTIRRAYSGERVFSRQILEKFDERSTRREITAREFQIMQMMAKGLTNREIAQVLTVSAFTVKNQVRSICQKLEVSHRTEAIRVAIERGLVVLD
jgi:DNA-binding NarL/FixJ family response regulator